MTAYGEDCMIKHGDLRYMHVERDRDVLFDLEAAPGETETGSTIPPTRTLSIDSAPAETNWAMAPA